MSKLKAVPLAEPKAEPRAPERAQALPKGNGGSVARRATAKAESSKRQKARQALARAKRGKGRPASASGPSSRKQSVPVPSRRSAKTAKKTPPSVVSPELLKLQAAADRARERYENEAAVDLYTRALGLVPPEARGALAVAEHELRMGRAECYERVGEVDAQIADIRAAEQTARRKRDRPRRVLALLTLSDRLSWRGEFDEALGGLQAAQDLAHKLGSKELLAKVAVARARHASNATDYRNLGELSRTALRLSREIGDKVGEAESLFSVATAEQSAGAIDQARQHLLEALAMLRSVGAGLARPSRSTCWPSPPPTTRSHAPTLSRLWRSRWQRTTGCVC